MIKKHKILSILILVFISGFILTIIAYNNGHLDSINSAVLGNTTIQSPLISGEKSIPSPQPNKIFVITPDPIPTAIAVRDEPTLTSIPPDYSITVMNIPEELIEGGVGTFTWSISGLPHTIKTTGVYFGPISHAGVLDKTVKPDESGYTQVTGDFLNGEYSIPLRFIGNMKIPAPGTYYCRAYALIDNQNYWSDERVFSVKEIPKNGVSIINPPSHAKKGENISFTWDVVGPSNITKYTVIVAGKTSDPGSLGTDIAIPNTPYTVLAKDFSNGTYNVPLRFIGNGTLNDPGVYFFRALTFINDKNYWSDEYQMTVE